jgi:hypothetical protein
MTQAHRRPKLPTKYSPERGAVVFTITNGRAIATGPDCQQQDTADRDEVELSGARRRMVTATWQVAAARRAA